MPDEILGLISVFGLMIVGAIIYAAGYYFCKKCKNSQKTKFQN